MTNQTSHAERRWRSEGDQMERDARAHAEECNDILTARQAYAVRDMINAFPQIKDQIIEMVFEECGWPKRDLNEAHLNEAGLVVWNIYKSWGIA
jgi:hypothetical protein